PFQGTYLNNDERGLRRTWNRADGAVDSSAGPPKEVYVFGGSAVYGQGARDAWTIPSCLARNLAQRGLNVRVTNHGQSGYVSTQEMIAALLQLQAGHRPEVVVFYDGVNDTYSALLESDIGVPQNESNRRQEFNLLKSPQRLALNLGSSLIERSSSYAFAK